MRRVIVAIWRRPDRRASLPRDAMEEDADGNAPVPIPFDRPQVRVGVIGQLIPGALLQTSQTVGTTKVCKAGRSNLTACTMSNKGIRQNCL